MCRLAHHPLLEAFVDVLLCARVGERRRGQRGGGEEGRVGERKESREKREKREKGREERHMSEQKNAIIVAFVTNTTNNTTTYHVSIVQTVVQDFPHSLLYSCQPVLHIATNSVVKKKITKKAKDFRKFKEKARRISNKVGRETETVRVCGCVCSV